MDERLVSHFVHSYLASLKEKSCSILLEFRFFQPCFSSLVFVCKIYGLKSYENILDYFTLQRSDYLLRLQLDLNKATSEREPGGTLSTTLSIPWEFIELIKLYS